MPSPSCSMERLAVGEAQIIDLNPQPCHHARNHDLGQIVYSRSRRHHLWPISSFSPLDLVIAAAASRSTHPWLILLSPPKIVFTAFISTPLWSDFNQVSQSTFLFPSISHSFFLPLSIRLSLRVNGLILIFVSLKSLYLAILYYKICLETKKMWETSRKFAFSRMLQNTWKYFLI